ncbi:TniQ family protein [Paenibacillus terrigena]|uniref:TniQ family protein n=1 Tax=Paenibacillus terrigena TaxID=369333 RepID=UPI000A063D36|nr:TniQ family protein [Paenibacillus terrigena]
MMNNGPLLPKRPKHFHDESESGYLFRLFKANHFIPNTIFLREIELTHAQLLNNEISEQALFKICPWMPSTEIRFINNTNRILSTFNHSWYNKIIQKNNLKYCPLCIQESYYHRLEWCVFPLRMCPKHFVILQEGCQTCNHPLDFYDFIEQRCKFCLSRLKRITFDHIQCEIFSGSQSSLARSIIYNEKSDIFELHANDYLELVFASFMFLDGCTDFTGFSHETLDIFYNRKSKTKNSLNLAIAFSNVDWMYSKFPNHFFHVLDLFLARNKGVKRYGAFQSLEKLVKHDCYAELREAFHHYCIQKLETGVIRRDFGVFREVPELLKKRKVIRREEVKIEKGVTYGKMFRLSNNNLVLMNQGTKNEYYVDRITLDKYLEEEKRWITKKEASLILGIHAASIESLISSNLLQVSLNYSGKSKRLNLNEVNLLIERCSGKFVKPIPLDCINFHDALIKYSVNNLTIVSLIQFILSGLLTPVRLYSKTTLGDLYFKNGEINECLVVLKKRSQKEQGYFFNDLLKDLKIGEKRLRRVLEERNIQPDFISYLKDGRRRYLYKETTKLRIQEVLLASNSNLVQLKGGARLT